MKIKPLKNKIQIEIKVIKEASGIILSENSVIIEERAEVLAVGEEVKKVKVGDTIFFKSWALDVIFIGKEQYNFLAEDDVIAIIE